MECAETVYDFSIKEIFVSTGGKIISKEVLLKDVEDTTFGRKIYSGGEKVQHLFTVFFRVSLISNILINATILG